MNQADFEHFKTELASTALGDPRVVGLVFLGSSSDATRRDQWSDHDFFLVVEAGCETDYRQNLSWLPRSFEVALAFQDTDHGVQAISKQGHLLEFAVFNLEELEQCGRVNAYTVMVDKSRLAEVLAHCARFQPGRQQDLQLQLGKVLSCSIIAMGRYARGERASGREVFLNGVVRALLHFEKLLLLHRGEVAHPRMDNLDVFRRLETTHPPLGQFLDSLEPLPVPEAILRVLDRVETLAAHEPFFPGEAHGAVTERARQAAGSIRSPEAALKIL